MGARKVSGRVEGILLAAVLVVIVLAGFVTVAFAPKFGWWLTPVASEHGREIDRLFLITLTITGIVFVLVQGTLAFFVFKYRWDKNPRAIHYVDNPKLEITWTVIVAVILTVLILSGGRLWSRIQASPPPEGAFVIEVWGEQFRWQIRYPGKDGKFGRTDMRLVTSDNPIGIDIKDPASKDDILFSSAEGDMHIPFNKPVVIYLRSKDVIHSLYIPAFRVKQDAVPGMVTRTWFVPKRKGTFEFACAELCGSQHYAMKGTLIVEDEAKVKEWLNEQTPVSMLLE